MLDQRGPNTGTRAACGPRVANICPKDFMQFRVKLNFSDSTIQHVTKTLLTSQYRKTSLLNHFERKKLNCESD